MVEELHKADERHNVLVVDDNNDVRRLIRKVLERAGNRVYEAVSGDDALRAVEELVPDLVLMDIRLPGSMDGLETTAQLKQDPRLARVPIVALTASVLSEDRQHALEAGCSGFIAKPVDITKLPEMVETFITHGPGAQPK